ncbi:MAG TPA: amidohydrolase family protein, partial [Gemmatimonadales bacterium]|nr:amidohydrolase family protein [Gemmatimonadales bacterium]
PAAPARWSAARGWPPPPAHARSAIGHRCHGGHGPLADLTIGMRRCRLAAEWVLPMTGPPIARGAVLIGSDGRIESVAADDHVPRPGDVVEERYDSGILLPGLINTHTHLELTGLAGGPPGSDFTGWVLGVRQAKAARSAEAFREAARRGVMDCWAGGVTTVADTGDSGAVIAALAELGGSGVVYHEVFGPHPGQVAESLAGLRAAVTRLSRHAAGRVRIGVSPHAPYTVSGDLYAATAAYAAAEGLPLAVHLAESRAESELLGQGSGTFADAWGRRGIPLPPRPGRSPVEWLDAHDVLGERTLCIHVVRASGRDLDCLARRGVAVAHCPLSNRAHGHGNAPLGDMLDRGLRVGVGTDSVLSVGVLDLLAEARAARALAGLDAAAALALCTTGAAAAIGLAGEIGSLEPGHWGDCVVLEPATSDLGPEERALACAPGDVVATYLGGRAVYRTRAAS